MRFKRTVALRRWTPLAGSLAMFALLCATIAYWVLQLIAPAVPIAPADSLAEQRDAPGLAAAARLFGLQPGDRTAAPSAAASSIQVLGVAASAVRGSAVLAVDGNPPKAYMVGDMVNADARLVEVRSEAAVIERNGARIELVAPQRPSVAILSRGPPASDASIGARAPILGDAPRPQPGPGVVNGRSSGPPAAASPVEPGASPAPAGTQPAPQAEAQPGSGSDTPAANRP